jgi:asparagine synthase (glutamine-hydrolysing)
MYVSYADALALVPKLPEIYDGPFADSSALPTYLVSARATDRDRRALRRRRRRLFAGYHHHFLGARVQRRVRAVPRFARRDRPRVPQDPRTRASGRRSSRTIRSHAIAKR